MNRNSYSQRQQILMRRLIAAHTVPVYKALQVPMKQAADYVRANGLKDPGLDVGLMNSEMLSAIQNLYLDAAIRAKKNYRSTKRFGGASDFITRVLDYLKNHILNKVVVPISNTTRSIISSTIDKAIQEGWGVEKTAKYLETAPITKTRARLIIRTESVRATNYTQLQAADDEVYQMEKTWIAIEDSRTRLSHSHAGVDGQTQDLNEPFTNGLLYPGDPEGDAAEVINCRCTLGYRAKRTLDGKPIKK